jgi:CrcB protein
MQNALMVAVGGALGALMRHGVYQGFKRFNGEAHWGTLCVNLVGALLAGYLWAAFGSKLPEQMRHLIFVGLLGAFTTFSTFKLDAHRLFGDGRSGIAIAYLAISMIAGLALVFAGAWAGTALHGKG